MYKAQGTIIQVLPEQSGVSKSGNTWTRQSFVIEYIDSADNRARKMCFGLWNKALGVQVGTLVDVTFSIDSNEYAGKYFVNLMAQEVTPAAVQPQYNTAAPTQVAPTQQTYQQAPQHNYAQAPAQNFAPIPKQGKSEDDDMPF